MVIGLLWLIWFKYTITMDSALLTEIAAVVRYILGCFDKLKGLSSEMDGGMKVVSIERSL